MVYGCYWTTDCYATDFKTTDRKTAAGAMACVFG